MSIARQHQFLKIARSLGLVAAVGFISLFSSCATIVNIDNNKSFKMGLDVVMPGPEPITVAIDGKPAKTKKIYDGEGYYAHWVYLDKAKERFVITITQNGETRSRKVYGEKAQGLFWFEFLFVLVDHATGTLRQYPAIVFENMESQASAK